MRTRYDAVVVGSGFGGAVASCRLAQAGFDVAILERGRRYDGPHAFPRDWNNLLDGGWLWPDGQGLIDVKPINEMQIVQAAGWGGGSLIYANVHLRPVPSVFASGWPTGYTREALDPYYDLVAYMLEVRPISDSQAGLPPKTQRMREAATRLERDAQFCLPNLAVRMEAAGQAVTNRFGVAQSGCNHCGECVIGCNHRAKNTLDLNYLAIAEQRGAHVATQCEVYKLEPLDGGGYRVHFRDHAHGGEDGFVDGKQLFLCAGAVNTTELLLRCRDQYGTMPDVSAHLGERYSGNGDLLAFAFDTDASWQPSVGPTITTALIYDRGDGDDNVWFAFEEGGFPKELAGVIQLLNPEGGFLGEAAELLRDELARAFADKARARIGASDGLHDKTAIFLVMGRDRANGRIGLQPLSGHVHVAWDVASNRCLYDAEQQIASDVAKALAGKVAFEPFWRRLHLPISVHNLGGCVMSDDAAGGVTSPIGEVWGYDGLFVLDGALLPSATGVNPSHTIAAVAERNIEAIIRRTRANGWSADEKAKATPIVDPVSKISIPKGGTMEPRTQTIGLSFSETMKGFVKRGFVPPDAFTDAEKAAQKADSYAQFDLTMTAPSLDEFLNEKTHPAVATGKLRVDGFTGPDGATVTNGTFNLFVETGDFYERKMLYALPFYGTDGKPYLLDGFKEIKDHGRFDVWKSTTTLYTVIRDGHSRAGAVLATGVLHIHFADVLRLISTFRVSGASGELEKVQAIGRFGEAFLGTLWHLFVGHKLAPQPPAAT